jgi:DNA-directed RNA polymerase specialized sigma24 family protein
MKVRLGKSDQNNLWDDIRNGNAEAFDQFYDQYVDILFSFGLSITNDAEHIKDSIHDLFFELYKYRRNFSDTVYNEKVQDPIAVR